MASKAKFSYQSAAASGRVVSLELSSHLRVTAVQIDGKSAEFFQHGGAGVPAQQQGAGPLLLVAPESLAPGVPHSVEISYEGSVVFRTAAGNYFVDERNSWYPFISPCSLPSILRSTAPRRCKWSRRAN